ncbi:MAG: SAM-dependent methyltransferase [Bacteroidia bacterium]|jgi:SAM-dependent methyltransferase
MRLDCSDILTELESWYASENGRYLLSETRQAIQHVLDTTFGYHILQLGVRTEQPLSHESPIHHRIYCGPAQGQSIDLAAIPEELPLECDSIDTVIAHHCLEFAEDPHQVLREIQRVLTPQGRLILIGFNPWSLYGLAGRTKGALRHPLWSAYRPVSEGRMTDWLHLLGCEVQDNIRLFSVPPVGGQRLRGWLQRGDGWATRHNLPLGGVYVLHALKQVGARHPPKSVRRVRRESLIGLVPKPRPTASPATPAPRPRLAATQRNNDA